MLKDGKYTITFKTPMGEGGGFLIMKDGDMVGGDNDYIYDGSYYKKGKAMKARILIDKYSDNPSATFGPARYIWLKAVYTEDADGKGFKGKASVIDVNPDIPELMGKKVPISGRLLD